MPETFRKDRLIVILGEHEAPASWFWEGTMFFTNEDGSQRLPPMGGVQQPLTAEEAEAHIGGAMIAQLANLDELAQRVIGLESTLATEREERAAEKLTLETKLGAAVATLRRAKSADQQWQTEVTNEVDRVLAEIEG